MFRGGGKAEAFGREKTKWPKTRQRMNGRRKTMKGNDQKVMEKGATMATHLELTAELVGTKVEIKAAGAGSAHLPKGSPPHRFTFKLTDNTDLNVKFRDPDWLWVDETTNCPPQQGIHTDQIDNLVRTDRTAAFTDLNSGPGRNLSYALIFECDDKAQVPKYDPIIINGGSN